MLVASDSSYIHTINLFSGILPLKLSLFSMGTVLCYKKGERQMGDGMCFPKHNTLIIPRCPEHKCTMHEHPHKYKKNTLINPWVKRHCKSAKLTAHLNLVKSLLNFNANVVCHFFTIEGIRGISKKTLLRAFAQIGMFFIFAREKKLKCQMFLIKSVSHFVPLVIAGWLRGCISPGTLPD